MAARSDLELLLTAKDEASSVLKKIGSGLGDVAKLAAGVAVGGGLTRMPSFLADAAKGAAEDAASMEKLRQSVENSGGSWDDYQGRLDEVIKSGQRKGETDDQIRDALALMTAQTGDAGEAINRLGLAEDLARGANIDLGTAAKLMGKVTDENVGVFKKLGIEVEKGAGETELFGAIQAKFGGQSETFAKSTAGMYAQTQIRMSELKETIGYAVLPIMTKLMTFITTVGLPALEKAGQFIGPLLKQAWDLVLPKFKEAQLFIETKIVPLFKEYWPQAVELARLKIQQAKEYFDTQLRPALNNIVTAATAVVNFFIQHWPEIWSVARPILEQLINEVRTVSTIVALVIGIIVNLISGDWQSAWNKAKAIVDTAINGVQNTVSNLGQLLRNLAPILFSAAQFLGDQLIQGIMRGINAAAGQVSTFAQQFLQAIKNLINSQVIDKINTSLQIDFDTHIPGVGVVHINPPDIPHLLTGMPVVPADMLAFIHKGESVIPPNLNPFTKPWGTTQDIYNVNITGPVYGVSDLEDVIIRAIRGAKSRGGFAGVFG